MPLDQHLPISGTTTPTPAAPGSHHQTLCSWEFNFLDSMFKWYHIVSMLLSSILCDQNTIWCQLLYLAFQLHLQTYPIESLKTERKHLKTQKLINSRAFPPLSFSQRAGCETLIAYHCFKSPAHSLPVDTFLDLRSRSNLYVVWSPNFSINSCRVNIKLKLLEISNLSWNLQPLLKENNNLLS